MNRQAILCTVIRSPYILLRAFHLIQEMDDTFLACCKQGSYAFKVSS